MENKKFYANLQPSEMAIFNAAASIFSSYVVSGKAGFDNENAMIKKSIEISMKMANIVEKAVQSDDEIAG
ncbi:MAG: hypothetical protein OEL66_10770 [Desulfobulbaceae bacterium]|nr:hypothetical protein [Desulfobulbaceae bacterium]